MNGPHPDRGWALLIAVIVVIIMVALTAGFLAIGLNTPSSTGTNIDQIQALESARAGMKAAVTEIRRSFDAAGALIDADGDGFSDADIDRDGMGVMTGKPFGGSFGLFDVKVYHSTGGVETEVTAASPVISSTADTTRVVAFGFVGFRPAGTGDLPAATAVSRSKFSASRAVEITLDARPTGNFTMGLFGKKALDVTGSVISDSTNSNDGDYTTQPTTPIVRANGDVGSNGPITLRGATMIHGDATAGPGQTTTLVGGGEMVSGSKEPLDEPKVFDPDPVPYDTDPDLPAGYSPGGGRPPRPGDPTTLSSGTLAGSADPNDPTEFRFGSVSMNGAPDAVTITGHVKMYVDDTITIAGRGSLTLAPGATLQIVQGPSGAAGGAPEMNIVANSIVKTSGAPPTAASLRISSASPGDLNLSGTSDFYGVIYAPSATVDLQGNSAVTGAVVANVLSVSGNPRFHYDEALATDGTGAADFARLPWREVTPDLAAYYP